MVASLEQSLIYRHLRLADIDDVMAVEQTNYDFPWSRQIFLDCLKAGYLCRALEDAQSKFIGYAIMTAAVQESHILNISVDADYQGKGFGRDFMNYLIDEAEQKASKHIILEVRPSNHVALKLYYSLGFLQIGVRRDYYQSLDGREDAIVMQLNLTGI